MARDFKLSAVMLAPGVPLTDESGVPTDEGRFLFETILTALFGATGEDDVTQSIAGTITLGTETQGDYVASLTGTGNMVVTGGTGEGSTPQVSITSNPTFNNIAANLVDGRDVSVDGIKLDGIATGATANASDAALRARASHTGTQAWSTITATPTTLGGYGITDGVAKSSVTAASTTHAVTTFAETDTALNAIATQLNALITANS